MFVSVLACLKKHIKGVGMSSDKRADKDVKETGGEEERHAVGDDNDRLSNDGIFRDGLTDGGKTKPLVSSTNHGKNRQQPRQRHLKLKPNLFYNNNPPDISYDDDYDYDQLTQKQPTRTRHRLSKFFHTPAQPTHHTSNHQNRLNTIDKNPTFFYNPFFDTNHLASNKNKNNRYI
jgi:hypothetical protein